MFQSTNLEVFSLNRDGVGSVMRCTNIEKGVTGTTKDQTASLIKLNGRELGPRLSILSRNLKNNHGTTIRDQSRSKNLHHKLDEN